MWFADNRHVDSWKGDGTCFGMHFGTILAPIWIPWEPWGSQVGLQGSREGVQGLLWGHADFGCFFGRFQGHPRILSRGQVGGIWVVAGVQLTSYNKVQDTKYRTTRYRIPNTGQDTTGYRLQDL